MNCFECRADLEFRKSFKVSDDLSENDDAFFCWPCVFKILRSHITDVRSRENDIDQKAQADELGYKKIENMISDLSSYLENEDKKGR